MVTLTRHRRQKSLSQISNLVCQLQDFKLNQKQTSNSADSRLSSPSSSSSLSFSAEDRSCQTSGNQSNMIRDELHSLNSERNFHHHHVYYRVNLISLILKLLLLQAVISHLKPLSYFAKNPSASKQFILFAEAFDCEADSDCDGDGEKICHESKCICGRAKPIEAGGNCLSLQEIGEQCQVDAQCLGNSRCIDGACSCGTEAISFFNPSSKLNYCHPKRQVYETCNYDNQCPQNSYCSSEKVGCLCQNGFAPALVRQTQRDESSSQMMAAATQLPTLTSFDKEIYECLPKFCKRNSDCESEFHHCDDAHCKCLPTHFDPTRARCYKFGSTGGVDSNLDQNKTSANLVDDPSSPSTGGFFTIFNDLRNRSDQTWLVVIIIIASLVILLVLILLLLLLLRRTSLCHCWTANKQEWDPKVAPASGASLLNGKDSINNKSFRRKKNVDTDREDEEEFAEERSNLVSGEKRSSSKNDYQVINFGAHNHQDDPQRRNKPAQGLLGPITSTKSTPV